MRPRVAKEGRWLLATTAAALLGGSAAIVWAARGQWPGLAAAAPLVAVWVWMVWFFRDPERAIPPEEGLFVSPADGMVTDITPVGPDSELGRPGRRIGVFMSVMNVHVNRAPCDAVVNDRLLNRGTRRDVRRQAAWHRNESVTLLLDYPSARGPLPVAVRQIAGLLARRIVCHARPGDRLRRGQRLGMIRFGSRLELLLPDELDAEIIVRPGQKVRAGASVLARHRAGPRQEPRR